MKRLIFTILITFSFSFLVKAQDTIPPVIVVKNPLDTYKIEIGDSMASVLDSIYATDNVTSSNELLKTLSIGGTYVHTFGIGPAYECGLFALVYTVEDDAKNESEFIRYVLVFDIVSPDLFFNDGTTYVIRLGNGWDFNDVKWTADDDHFPASKLKVDIISDNVDTSKTGLYEVVYRVEDPCGNYRDYRLTVAVVGRMGGTSEIGRVINLKAYPNPTSGLVRIDAKDLNGQKVSIKIFDTQGKMLADYGQFQTESVIELPNLGSFENGIYFLQISTARSITVKKIILSK